MAEQTRNVRNSPEIELDNLSADDKINLIGKICDELTAQQLRVVREIVDQKRLEKVEEAKKQVIAEIREKFEELELDFDEVMGRKKRRVKSTTIPAKYISPDGQKWSGRGYAPAWIKMHEESGGSREDYRVQKTKK